MTFRSIAGWMFFAGMAILQIGIEAGIWSVFNMDPSVDTAGPTELVNTDFYVGLPITYAVNQWSFKLRVTISPAT